MDIRKIFEALSNELTAKFQKTIQIKHNGGKGDNREDAFADFLKEYLPNKYGIGRGEVISPENEISGELDIVIFDKDHCPLFIKSDSHSIYPRESVFGAICMKSHLDSTELKDAYNNIASLKKIMSSQGFTNSPIPGMDSGLSPVVPVTAIFAYAANRSLEAIAQQVNVLDKELNNIKLRPDYVVVLGEGIVGPSGRIRNNFNMYNLPQDSHELVLLRATGRHTLLRFYMQLLDELNSITQPNLNLHSYFDMPSRVGTYKVRMHDKLMLQCRGDTERTVKQLKLSAIERIVEYSKMVSLEQHYINHLGNVPLGVEQIHDLTACVYEYNPLNKPSIKHANIQLNERGQPVGDVNPFQPYGVEIDGKLYAIDIGSLSGDDFEENPDFTVTELLSQ